MALKAVLFDLDGVIVDTAKFHYIAWKALADRQGIYFDEEINERLKGVSRMASLDIILERSENEHPEAEKATWAAEKNSAYVAMVKQITPAEILPGVMSLLNELSATDIKCAICSVSKSAGMIIDLLGLKSSFDVVVSGADITRSKPDPQIFEFARDHLGFASDECLVIEDAFVGIEAAKNIGMKTFGIGNPTILAGADVIYADMTGFTLADMKKLFK